MWIKLCCSTQGSLSIRLQFHVRAPVENLRPTEGRIIRATQTDHVDPATRRLPGPAARILLSYSGHRLRTVLPLRAGRGAHGLHQEATLALDLHRHRHSGLAAAVRQVPVGSLGPQCCQPWRLRAEPATFPRRQAH